MCLAAAAQRYADGPFMNDHSKVTKATRTERRGAAQMYMSGGVWASAAVQRGSLGLICPSLRNWVMLVEGGQAQTWKAGSRRAITKSGPLPRGLQMGEMYWGVSMLKSICLAVRTCAPQSSSVLRVREVSEAETLRTASMSISSWWVMTSTAVPAGMSVTLRARAFPGVLSLQLYSSTMHRQSQIITERGVVQQSSIRRCWFEFELRRLYPRLTARPTHSHSIQMFTKPYEPLRRRKQDTDSVSPSSASQNLTSRSFKPGTAELVVNKSVTWIDSQNDESLRKDDKQASSKPVSILKRPSFDGSLALGRPPKKQEPRLNSSRMSMISTASMSKSQYREFGPKTLIAEYNARDEGQFRKYSQIREDLIKQKRKFTDDQFPPTINSLINSVKGPSAALFKSARWERLPDFFKAQTCLLLDKDRPQDLPSFERGQRCPLPILRALGVISRSPILVSKCFDRFQSRAADEGMYSIKICQEGIWKHVFLDDYYPILEGKPVFLQPKGRVVELWPFLLVKALAKVYGSFESMAKGDLPMTLHELTGVCPVLLVNVSLQNFADLHKATDRDLLVIACAERAKAQKLCRADREPGQLWFNVAKVSRLEGKRVGQLQLLDEQQLMGGDHLQREGNRVRVSFDWLSRYFSWVYMLRVPDDEYYVARPLRQAKDSHSVRFMNVGARSRCMVGLVQKDERHFRNGAYEYSWARLLICQKDVDGYRYICGRYSREKAIWLQAELEEGEYALLVVMEWAQKQFELVLTYWGSTAALIDRRQDETFRQVLSDVAVDVSQRFGVRKQINVNLCVYSLPHLESGLIFQNFNNENSSRPLNLKKSYRRQSRLQFLRELSQLLDGQGILEVKIPSKGSVTVVFQVLGGRVNEKDIVHFDFS